jgi:glycosyltransferase involved in cell wall biosynthesis
MRIMMVTIGHGGPTDWGGAELHVRSLAQALSERGHGVALLTKRLPGRPAQLPGVEAIFSTTTSFPHIFTKLFQFDPVVYLTTLRFLRTWSPDVVHLHSFLNISFAPIAAAARLQIPVLATVHSYWPVCLRHRLCYNEDRTCQRRYVREVCAPCLGRGLRNQTGVRFPVPLVSLVLRGAWRARQHVLQKVARFIAPSGALAWSLRESGFPADRIVNIPHGLPEGDFVVRPREAIPERRFVHLLCVGRLVPGKGVQYLLEALDQIRQAYPNLNLILTVAGDGWYQPELERLCASLGLTAVVRFVGAQSRSRLPELYAEADLVVLPSLSEIFPYVALEAAATGVPVVATNVGGIPEILGDGAFLVPPMDPEALAEGILTALSDRTAAAARAKLAQERYLARFDFGTMVDRTEAVYAELRHRAHVP